MRQQINGFHLDSENHWVAELVCGHAQHVRHDPPWMERPWVITAEGRASRMGTELNCVRCDEAAQKLEGPLSLPRIGVVEPFAKFLGGSEPEWKFEISLLDVVRFAGHACPSMVGAFFIAKRAVEELYPESQVCVRGDLEVVMPGGPGEGAIGPIANVFGFITGAWGETGFGGMKGEFARRNLLRFDSNAKDRAYKFTRRSTDESVSIFYEPSKIPLASIDGESFQSIWRRRISDVMQNPAAYLTVVRADRESR